MSKDNIKDIIDDDYKYGFITNTKSIIDSGKGLNEDVIRFISKCKSEPEFMLKERLDAYKSFCEQKNPKWGPDLSLSLIHI